MEIHHGDQEHVEHAAGHGHAISRTKTTSHGRRNSIAAPLSSAWHADRVSESGLTIHTESDRGGGLTLLSFPHKKLSWRSTKKRRHRGAGEAQTLVVKVLVFMFTFFTPATPPVKI